MAEYIEREAAVKCLCEVYDGFSAMTPTFYNGFMNAVYHVKNTVPAADVVEVMRCQDCIHSEPFERNCELNTSAYMHCTLDRGETVRNVWHKYKKYYRDYSVVDRDGFCDAGERRKEDETT